MKKTLSAVILSALSLHAAGQPALTFHFKGESASALFSSIEGCLSTDVFVNATDNRIVSTPNPGMNAVSSVFIVISRSIIPTPDCVPPPPPGCPPGPPPPQLVAIGGADLQPQDFQVSGNLGTASLKATVQMLDVQTNSFFDVFIELSWAGGPAINHSNNQFRLRLPGVLVNSESSGFFRDATASGSVTRNGANLTPAPSAFANISRAQSGSINVLK